MKLLDANVLIHYFQGREPVVARMRRESRRDLRLPSIVAYELEYGSLKSGSVRRKAMQNLLLRELIQVPFDGTAAAEAARIRVELEGRGEVIGPIDLLIAATAMSVGATLVTNNSGEFSRVNGLRMEDWTR